MGWVFGRGFDSRLVHSIMQELNTMCSALVHYDPLIRKIYTPFGLYNFSAIKIVSFFSLFFYNHWFFKRFML